jgi:hypothetical protein
MTFSLGLVVPAAVAGEVPASAYSRSLGIPPILLEHVAIAFQFPYRAATVNSQVFALGLFRNTSNNSTGLGGLLRHREDAFFVFSQPASDLAPQLGNNRAVQFGWGRATDEVRLGASIRGARRLSGSSESYASPPHYRDGFYNLSAHVVEAAVGVGAGDPHRFFDLVFELRTQKSDQDRRESSRTETRTTSTRVRLRAEDRLAPAVALRLGTTVAGATRLVAAATWTEESFDSAASLQVDTTSVTRPTSNYGRRWQVAAAAYRPLVGSGELTVFGQYRRNDGSESHITTSTFSREQERVDSALIGAGLERNLWRWFDGLVGLRAEYLRTTSATTLLTVRYGEIYESSSGAQQEDWVDRFSWGLAFRHQRFELLGSLDARLSLDNLFLNLDATYYF